MATRAEITAIVKKKIDELTPFDEGLALITATVNVANNPVDLYIEQFLNESAKETLLEAPVHVLPMTAFASITFDLTLKKATITIPTSSYLRVGIIKFASWERPVYRATYPGDPDYNKQFNIYLRSGKSRPRAVWINDEGTPKLVCYGVESNTDYDARYVGITWAENMPSKLIEPMTWHCAFQVLEVFDKDKLSQTAYARYSKALSLL
jgi:hypothetical protein